MKQVFTRLCNALKLKKTSTNALFTDRSKGEDIELSSINGGAMQVNLPSAMNANLLSLRNTDKSMSKTINPSSYNEVQVLSHVELTSIGADMNTFLTLL